MSAGAARLRGEHAAVIGGGAGLVAAAVVYPAARRDHAVSPEFLVEAGVVLGASALAFLAARRDPAAARRLVAAGWASHALFDLLVGPSPDSRLPGWYPSVCAGYDLAFAAELAR